MTTFDSLILWAILEFGATILIVLGYLALKAYRHGLMLRAIVLGMTVVHEFFLIIFPACYSGFNGFKLEAEIGGEPENLMIVIIGELLFVVAFAAIFAITSRVKPNIGTTRCDKYIDNTLLYILVLSGIWFAVGSMLSPGYNFDDITHHADVIVRTNILEIIRTWAVSFNYWPSIIAASMVVSFQSFPLLLRYLGGTVVVLRLALCFTDGVRGGVLLILGLLIAFGFLSHRRRYVYALLIMAMITMPLMPLIKYGGYLTANASQVGASRSEVLLNVLPLIKSFYDQDREKIPFVESWVERAQGARNSISLYNLFDRDEGAGCHPLIGAILMPIPRVIWPDKPAAGSTDSTNLGAAIFRVQQAKPDSSFFEEMGPLTASAHSYWEGGFPWLVLSGALTGLFWSGLLKWAEKSDRPINVIVVFGFMAALPIDGFYSMLNPLYTYVRIVWTLVIPIFLIEKIILWLRTLFSDVFIKTACSQPSRLKR